MRNEEGIEKTSQKQRICEQLDIRHRQQTMVPLVSGPRRSTTASIVAMPLADEQQAMADLEVMTLLMQLVRQQLTGRRSDHAQA